MALMCENDDSHVYVEPNKNGETPWISEFLLADFKTSQNLPVMTVAGHLMTECHWVQVASSDTTSSFAFDANSPSTFTQKVSLTNILTSAGILKWSNLSAKLVFSASMKPVITAVICWPDVCNVGKWSICPGHRSAEKSVSFFWNAWSFSLSCVTVWSLPCSS